jgi:hypothetical protein
MFLFIPRANLKLKCLTGFRLFLKCKHTAGSGAGSGGNSNKDISQSQQIATTLKNVLADLQERKEDFEKLKQKVERLEVGVNESFLKNAGKILIIIDNLLRHHKRNLLTCRLHWKVSDIEQNG